MERGEHHSFSSHRMLWSILTTLLSFHQVQAGLDLRQSKNVPVEQKTSTYSNDTDALFRFVTRPDIGAPKWDMKVYDEEALAPGYWFSAPYANLAQTTYPLWNGPHIYDGNGELIWSGSPMFKHFNTHDFKTAMVDGEQMLSLIFPHDEPGTKATTSGMRFPHEVDKHGSGIILDSSYNVHKTVNMRGDLPKQNMHDLTLRQDGKRALMLTSKPDDESIIHVDGFNGSCKAGWQGFKEVDVETGKAVFEWNAEGHIPETESTKKDGTWNSMCKDEWDLLHFNSIDKFDHGDYLISARHTNTIYKISHKDGSIIWRLGGLNNDFHFNDDRAKFTRQHHSKIHDQNETHTIISLFANDMGHGNGKAEKPSSESSWGLLLALRTDVRPMTVDLISRYQHPLGGFSPSRGSLSFLPNGNAFVGWVFQSLHSEHAADGRLLMQASVPYPGVNTYRAYKLPWVGKPSQPPDVSSVALESSQNGVTTLVHVSWNGATEVATWNLLHTDRAGKRSDLLASTSRQGFETALSCDRFAKYVVVVALDVKGQEIGRSKVVETSHRPKLDKSLPVAKEAQWLQNPSTASNSYTTNTTSDTPPEEPRGWFDHPAVAFTLGFVCCVVAGCIGLYLLRRARPTPGHRGTFWWFSPRSPYRSDAGSNEEDMEQREWMLDDKEIDEGDAPSRTSR